MLKEEVNEMQVRTLANQESAVDLVYMSRDMNMSHFHLICFPHVKANQTTWKGQAATKAAHVGAPLPKTNTDREEKRHGKESYQQFSFQYLYFLWFPSLHV